MAFGTSSGAVMPIGPYGQPCPDRARVAPGSCRLGPDGVSIGVITSPMARLRAAPPIPRRAVRALELNRADFGPPTDREEVCRRLADLALTVEFVPAVVRRVFPAMIPPSLLSAIPPAMRDGPSVAARRVLMFWLLLIVPMARLLRLSGGRHRDPHPHGSGT
ncbi:hypothetical protein [Tautonia plasticadhaerens]|uniref:Uncharacterized protein n=1 Tax=Tautonia plasticadhaerens TaxID=2527974 RepID=A0A518HDN7_9BACT|nr:hypothetical protein [Tautonia plasticadhaerens]QDV38967.1 hypothetical protein ElP_69270 [Tautonia plasticadhaerens]